MSISNETVKAIYSGNGSTTTFAIPADLISDANSEVKVLLRDETDPDNPIETPQSLGADYTLTGANPPTTPFPTDVEMNTAPTSDEKLVVYRDVTNTQPLDLQNSGPANLEAIELALDRVTAMVQEHKEILSRAPKMSVGHALNDPFDLPEPFSQGLWGWHTDKTFKYYTVDELAILVNDTYLQKSANLSDLVSAAASRVNLDLGGFSAQQTAAIADSVGPVNFGSLQLDGDLITSFWLWVEIVRGSTHTTRLVPFHFKASAWIVENDLLATNDLDGIVFSVNPVAGNIYEVQYTSDASGAGTAKYKGMKFDV